MDVFFCLMLYGNIFLKSLNSCIAATKIMHQSIPAALSSAVLLRGICPPCQSRGWGICKFCAAQGPGICQPRGQPRAFDTHTVSYQNQNITTQRISLEKQADWLIFQGREKFLKRFVKAFSWFYACISSLLIKPELHSEIGSYRRESKSFGLLNQISLDVIWRTSFHIYKTIHNS